jgi:hypothetical protein
MTTNAHLVAQLSRAHGAKRIDDLVTCDDPAGAVATLTFSEVYELVHTVGFEDAQDLIALATPEQIRGCIDLDGWDKDVFEPHALAPWFTALLTAGFEKVGEAWAGLDPEFRALWLQKHTTIYDTTMEEELPESDELPLMPTPDRFYVLALHGDDETQRITQAIVEDLYRADATLARHTILTARAEPAAELEEMTYRWRSGRLADIGYVDFYDALDLFRPLEMTEVAIGEGSQDVSSDIAPSDLPVPIVQEMLGRTFLAAALSNLASNSEQERVQLAILLLVNRVLAAGRAKPGQAEVMRRGALYATATLSLGLESVARGDLDKAAQALRSIGVLRLFRVGFTLTRRLSRLAAPLRAAAAIAASPGKEVVAAVSGQRPLFPRAADLKPHVGLRPIETTKDIRVLADILGRVTVTVALVEKLGLEPAVLAGAPEPRPTLEHFVQTAVCRAALGGSFTPGPLSQIEIGILRSKALRGSTWTADARDAAHAAVANALASLGIAPAVANVHTDAWLARIAHILGDVKAAAIDPRFVDGVLIAAN